MELLKRSERVGKGDILSPEVAVPERTTTRNTKIRKIPLNDKTKETGSLRHGDMGTRDTGRRRGRRLKRASVSGIVTLVSEQTRWRQSLRDSE
ncbi:hypothetical protein ACOMHN_049720 [Nucella lapillus]